MDERSERLPRLSVPAMDEILGIAMPVLDDGFVRVIDYLGSDESIVQAARVSYGQGTRRVHEDRGLIRYLLRHRHTTPFEMCEIKLHVRVPMDSWRQWIRHRTANVNEYSTRYSVAIDVGQRTAADQWRLQTALNRQGSEGWLDEQQGGELSRQESELHERCRSVYQDRLKAGVAREQARKDLPLSTYTEAYWKIDLHNLLHFLALRMHATAQFEIRCYAEMIGNRIVGKWCPVTWEAFLDYTLNAMTLSRLEVQVLSALTRGNTQEALRLAVDFGWMAVEEGKLKRNRERAEFEEKLEAMSIPKPW